MSNPEESAREYVRENRDMVTRILHHGTEDARAYAFALLVNADDPRSIEEVKRELEELC